jgi:hypothetical protein
VSPATKMRHRIVTLLSSKSMKKSMGDVGDAPLCVYRADEGDVSDIGASKNELPKYILYIAPSHVCHHKVMSLVSLIHLNVVASSCRAR